MKEYIRIAIPDDDDALYFQEPFTKWQAWQDLIFLALDKNKSFFVRGIKVDGKKGSVYISQSKLAERWQWDKKKVIRHLKNLVKLGLVTLQKSNVINCISIKNYERFCTTNDTTNDTTKRAKGNPKDEANYGKSLFEDSLQDSYKPKTIDCSKFVEFWNRTMERLRVPKIHKIADKRKETLNARASTYGEDAVMKVVCKIAQSDFLSGRKTDFKADFDWAFGPKNFPKVLDGKYDNEELTNQQNNNDNANNRRDPKFTAIEEANRADLLAIGINPDEA